MVFGRGGKGAAQIAPAPPPSGRPQARAGAWDGGSGPAEGKDKGGKKGERKRSGRSTLAMLRQTVKKPMERWDEDDDNSDLESESGGGKGPGGAGAALSRLCCCCCGRCGRRGAKDPKAKWSPFRLYVNRVVKSSAFSNFILFMIFLNSVLITLQMVDSTNLVASYYFDVFDKVLMAVYIMELTMKLFAQRSRFRDSGWNIFDACIVSISVLETALFSILNNTSSISPSIFRLFRVFKALRAMRALRAISFLKNLQVIIGTLLKSIPAMGSIILLLVLILYIFAIIFVTLYKDIMPNRFGNLWLSMFSLFQLITLDDWSEYYHTVYRKDPSRAPSIMAYMSIFIVLETFICINLFIAVIVNNLERANEKERQKKKRRQEQDAARMGEEGDAAMPLFGAEKAQDKKLRRRLRRKRRRKRRHGHGAKDAHPDDGLEGGVHEAGDVGNASGKDANGKDASAEAATAGARASHAAANPSDSFLSDPSLPFWQRELQPEILALVASLEHHTHVYNLQQQTLDNLVDVTARTRDSKHNL